MTGQSPKLITLRGAAKKLDIKLEFLLSYIDSINSFSSDPNKQVNLYALNGKKWEPGKFKNLQLATRSFSSKDKHPFSFKNRKIRPKSIEITKIKLESTQVSAIKAGPSHFRNDPKKMTEVFKSPERLKELKAKAQSARSKKGIKITYDSKNKTVTKGKKNIKLTDLQAPVFEILYKEYLKSFENNKEVKHLTAQGLLRNNDTSKSDRIRDIFRSREKHGIFEIIKKDVNKRYYLE